MIKAIELNKTYLSTVNPRFTTSTLTANPELPRAIESGLQNTYFTFFEFATFFRFLSLDLRFFLKKRTVNRQTLNRS